MIIVIVVVIVAVAVLAGKTKPEAIGILVEFKDLGLKFVRLKQPDPKLHDWAHLKTELTSY